MPPRLRPIAPDWQPRLDGGEAGDATPLRHRVAWLAAIWLASVVLLGAVAWLLRLWLA